MSGHSVSKETGHRAVDQGVLRNDYGDVRCYLYNGDHYFVPVSSMPGGVWPEPKEGETK